MITVLRLIVVLLTLFGSQTVALGQIDGYCVAPKKPDFIVTPDGVAIPTNPKILKEGMSKLDDVSTSPATSRKFVGEDSVGPVRVRIEKAHPEDPGFTGTPDPLHTVDHLHIDRRKNITSGQWKSKEKVEYEWPFDSEQ